MPPISTAVSSLHGHLSLTARRPVETGASRWLGEAEAIVADLVHDQTLEPDVIHDRLTRVSELLAEVDRTNDPIAEHHVELAREVTELVLTNLADKQ